VTVRTACYLRWGAVGQLGPGPGPSRRRAAPAADQAPDWRVPIARSSREKAAFRWFLLLYFLVSFSQGVYPPLLAELMGDLGLSFAGVGLLGAAFGVARLALDLPAGVLLERIGATGVLHAGLGLIVVGTTLTASASSLPTLLLARGLTGLGSGMSMVVALIYLMRAGAPEQRTRRGNMLESALIAGQSISAYLAGAISVRASWRWGFGLGAVAVTLGWLVAAVQVLPVLRARGPEPPPAPPRAPGPAASSSTPGTFLAIYMAAFGLAFGWAGGIATLAPLYGGQALGLTSAVIGRTMALAYAIEVVVLIPVGWAADTFGRLRVLLPGFGLILTGVVLLPLSGGVPSYTLACTLVIVGMTVWMIPPSLLAERLSGRVGGRVIGVYRFTADLATVVAPAAVGWLIERGGFGAGAGAIAVVLAACVSVVVANLARRRLAPHP
jgi:MFS family permease